ncbi:MmgE/PrpD family protein [Pararhizobium haloflavum]|uniref:MmgE/PrpD family protein n=1 Tax=Pararhizobium haloflavum TaxID=2037914 RepID=UPI000C18B897|nr:MmgE/PrpD family protein [Pararhizobium haloflavum]
MSLTSDLVQLIRNKPVSQDDLDRAASFVVDTLACALAARQTPPARALSAVAPWTAGDTARRAFHFGGLSHILELDDLHRTSVTHPATVVIPAAAAVAEAEGRDGVAFLTAVLHGYEACCRVGNAVGKAHYRVWHNTATCGTFGSAMAAASLMDLSEEQTVWALGNAGTQSGGLWEFLSAGAMSKHLHTARAAESGVLAAALAREGFTGPDTILEGEKGFFVGLCPDPQPELVTAQPDAAWELTRSSIKPWPCCRHTHPTIDAAIALHGRLSGAAIASIEVATYQAALDVCDRPQPTEPYGAKFSLQHCVAEALTSGRVTPSSFDADQRDALSDLRGRTALSVDGDVNAAYPAAWGAKVTVVTGSGERLVETRAVCKGDPDNPLTRDELTEKAVALFVLSGMEARGAETLVEDIYGLASGAPLAGLFDSCFTQSVAPARPVAVSA